MGDQFGTQAPSEQKAEQGARAVVRRREPRRPRSPIFMGSAIGAALAAFGFTGYLAWRVFGTANPQLHDSGIFGEDLGFAILFGAIFLPVALVLGAEAGALAGWVFEALGRDRKAPGGGP